MSYKFENLDVWQLSLGYADHIYEHAEQARGLERASRSLIETGRVLPLIHRRDPLDPPGPLREAYPCSETLFAKLQSFRSTLNGESSVQEEQILYEEGPSF